MKKKTLEVVMKQINAFNEARGWNPTPHDLSKSIVIEAAELLEKFQWDDTGRNDDKNWEEVGEEVADVFWYLIRFCAATNLDLVNVVEDKMIKNEKKYPEEMFKGEHNDEFYKAQKLKYRQARKASG